MNYAGHNVQTALEQIFAKNNLHKRIRKEFLDAGIEQHLTDLQIDIQFGIDLLVQMVLHKRAKMPILVGILKNHFNTLQQCADAIIEAAKKDIIDYEEMSDSFIMKYDVTDDVYEELNQYQYPLPCVVPPKEVNNNKEYGYFTIKGSVILRNNHHDDDVNLDHINRVNKIRLSLNPDTVRLVQNQWNNLDKAKPGETFEEYQKRRAAFLKYDKDSRNVIEAIIVSGNLFHLTHRYDKRGRTYSQGYHINYQGNDWNKAVIEFADKEICE